ncbi:transmembrane protein [Legionella birminghamensis]|uniref:Transmembrane protein n=1 Tax=Legionella birminghamensis TaxID=28083 RepID=A0A378IE12_9GAMM|nr:ECF transporter S component [Legionella birminghamensis]KTC75342.1 transmembrane protein [Legionella birminghamensis]STX33110.1 transmembrane protein [Legionella birminghamensis]
MKLKSESFKKVKEESKPDAEELYEKGFSQAIAFMLAIPGRLDAQARSLAKKLHDSGNVYTAFAVIDALNLSISNDKLVFDLAYTNSSQNSADAMHDWLLTPAGISIAVTQSVGLVALSVMGNCFDENDKNWLKSSVATLWPYMRDVMKALKNAYKGIRSLMQVANAFDHSKAFNPLILPLGLTFGILASINRLWYRYMLSIRKESMRLNAKYLAMIQERKDLAANEIEEFRKAVRRQTTQVRIMALLSATYGGVIDSLYLYLGVMSLCPLSIPSFVIMTVFSAIYCVTCVVTRMYEEYDFQQRLVIKQAQIELALYTQEYRDLLTQKFAEIEALTLKLSKRNSAYYGGLVERMNHVSGEMEFEPLSSLEKDHLEKYEKWKAKQQELTEEIYEILNGFSKRRQYLQNLVLLSNSSAFLAGLKQGLAAYGALASMVFSVATFLTLGSIAFPPFLMIAFVSSGIALLIGFAAYAIYKNHKYRTEQTPEKRDPYLRLSDFLKECVELQNPKKLGEDEDVSAVFEDELLLYESPQDPIQSWFEFVRSCCSFNKGLKATDFTLNPLQDADENGHYHDTPVMLVCGVISSAIHSVILGARALARGFGRDSIDKIAKKEGADVELQEMQSKNYPPAQEYEEDEAYNKEEEPSPGSEQGSERGAERPSDSPKSNLHRRSASMLAFPTPNDDISKKALNSPMSPTIFKKPVNPPSNFPSTSLNSAHTGMGLM